MPNEAVVESAPIELTITRKFNAPRDRVFRAWTDPEKLSKWWGPENRICPFAELDPQPGGRWRTCMRAEDGQEAWVQGEYREVEPPSKLSFTWAWETDGIPGPSTFISIDFLDHGAETEMVFTHSGFESEEQKRLHNEGWTGSLNSLHTMLGKGE